MRILMTALCAGALLVPAAAQAGNCGKVNSFDVSCQSGVAVYKASQPRPDYARINARKQALLLAQKRAELRAEQAAAARRAAILQQREIARLEQKVDRLESRVQQKRKPRYAAYPVRRRVRGHRPAQNIKVTYDRRLR